ncbi:hypothetical protein [Ramlibacter sp. 2FC]|uniref:hypothetical protein n=1 Tax=Ramlibacter sp. 2FC TaxID=2502188 RepID=UPI00201D8879|nr:hypothetical protein [Ramlibacter sp. 2FC]
MIRDSYVMPEHVRETAELPAFGRMVLNFGVVYKKRRLNFVLYEVNDLYPGGDSEPSWVVDSESLDLLKLKIHKCIDELAVYEDIRFLSMPAVSACRALFMPEAGGRLAPGRARPAGAARGGRFRHSRPQAARLRPCAGRGGRAAEAQCRADRQASPARGAAVRRAKKSPGSLRANPSWYSERP